MSPLIVMKNTKLSTTKSVTTKKEFLKDGLLIDVTDEAKDLGFKIPIVIESSLFHRYIVPPEELAKGGHSLEERLYDVLEMLKGAASMRWKNSRVLFNVLFLVAPGKLEQVQILAFAEPGDKGEPVLRICLPNETY